MANSIECAATAFALGLSLAACEANAPEQRGAGDNSLAAADERACTTMNGGPRPFPALPSGANQSLLRKGGDIQSLSDTFEPVWGRVCLRNGAASMLEVSAEVSDGSTVKALLLQGACADFNTPAASMRANCVNDQPPTCAKYTYTAIRRCPGSKPETIEVEPHASHVYHRFDVNPSQFDFMRKAVDVRASKVRPSVFMVSHKLATVEVCKKYPDATLVAYADSAGTGTQFKRYVLRDQPPCFTVQGRNLSVRLNAPYPPHTTPPPTVLSYRLLSF